MTHPIKLAHLVCVLPPYGGGLGVAAHNQAELMVEAGFDVTVIAPEQSETNKVTRKYKIDPVRSIFQLGHGLIAPTLYQKLFSYDIVHLHFPFFGAIFPAIRAKIKRGDKLKLVVTYHQDLILAGWKSLYYKLVMYFLTPILLRLADKIVVSTFDYVRSSFIKNYFQANEKKFAEISFSVSEQFTPNTKNEKLLQKHKLKPDDFIVLFVGGLDWAHYFKGVDNLIEAFTQIQEPLIKALIVGSGNLKSTYEKQVEEARLEEKVLFTGYVPDELLPEYYNLADVVILPSVERNEAFGIVLIEAMACGKPILASDLPGVRTVVEDGANGLVLQPRSVNDIIEKILMIYNNTTLKQTLSLNAQQTVAKKYRPLIIKNKLQNLYNNL